MNKVIEGFENYTISDDGIVTNIKTNKNKTGTSNHAGNGYLYVDLYKNNKAKRFYIHRLVAKAFIPNPENKPQVNHKDGNTKNNTTSNLEWVTALENVEHASKVLNVLSAYKNANEKRKKKVAQIDINTNKVVNIFNSMLEAQKQTGINTAYISQTCKGKFYQCFGYHWCYVEELKGE